MADTAEVAKPIPSIARGGITYPIPDSIRLFETDPQSITIRPYTLREEMDANQIVTAKKGSVADLMVELTRKSVFKLNGKAIDYSTDQPEWLERASPKVRDLAIDAVTRLCRPSKEETDLFFKSGVAEAG